MIYQRISTLPVLKPKLAIFGGTGGLGQWVSPLLENDFQILSLGSKGPRVESSFSVNRFFEKEGYIPYIIYMAVKNFDSVIHKIRGTAVIVQTEVNIYGFVNVLRFSLPFMRENKYGRIIYISSILSERPIPGTGIYAATKAFNDSIIKTCALENAKYDITCNSLQLGYFDAGLTHTVPKEIMNKVMEKIPVDRLGNANDLNTAIRFIFDSPYLTGVNLPLSGGLNIT